MGKNISKYISKILSSKHSESSKHSQTLLDHSKQSGTDAVKASKWVIQKTAEAIDVWSVLKLLIKSVTNEQIPKERYVSLEERQKIIDELRLK